MVKVGDKVRILHNGWCNEDKASELYRHIYNAYNIGQIVEVDAIEASNDDVISISVYGKYHSNGDYIFQSVSNTKDKKIFEVV